jgi:hypothetical protein
LEINNLFIIKYEGKSLYKSIGLCYNKKDKGGDEYGKEKGTKTTHELR